MTRTEISKDPSGRIIVSFSYAPVFVSKVKTIEGRRWQPAEKHWSFPNVPYPPHRWERKRKGMKKFKSGLSLKFAFEDLRRELVLRKYSYKTDEQSSAGGWRKSKADAAHQAANGFAKNALWTLPPATSRYLQYGLNF